MLFNAFDSISLRRREGFIRSPSLLSAPPSGRLHNISFNPRPPRRVPRCSGWHACLLTTAVHDWRGLVVLWVEWWDSLRRWGHQQPNLKHSKSGGTFSCLNATKQRQSFLKKFCSSCDKDDCLWTGATEWSALHPLASSAGDKHTSSVNNFKSQKVSLCLWCLVRKPNAIMMLAC